MPQLIILIGVIALALAVIGYVPHHLFGVGDNVVEAGWHTLLFIIGLIIWCIAFSILVLLPGRPTLFKLNEMLRSSDRLSPGKKFAVVLLIMALIAVLVIAFLLFLIPIELFFPNLAPWLVLVVLCEAVIFSLPFFGLPQSWVTAWNESQRGKQGWKQDDGGQQKTSDSNGPMTRAKALEVLGLSEGASEQEIKGRYRSLMQKVHSDRGGGSDYFAKQLNEAKRVLLD